MAIYKVSSTDHPVGEQPNAINSKTITPTARLPTIGSGDKRLKLINSNKWQTIVVMASRWPVDGRSVAVWWLFGGWSIAVSQCLDIGRIGVHYKNAKSILYDR